jgi:subtilisin family serine protease
MIRRQDAIFLMHMLLGLLLLQGCGKSPAETPDTETAPDLALTLTTGEDKTVYTEGEQISFAITASSDCYVTVFLEGVQGELILLFPNGWDTKGKCTKDIACHIPSRLLGFRFPILPPHGQITVKAIASEKPLPLRNVDVVRLGTEGFVCLRIPSSIPDKDTTLISDDLLMKPLKEVLAGTIWTSAELTVETRAMPVYASSGNEAVMKKWTELNTKSGTKALLTSLAPMRPFTGNMDQKAEGLIVYYKESQSGTKSLDKAGAPASVAQREGSPLGRARVVTSGPDGTKALGPADMEKRLEDLQKDPSVAAAIPNYMRHMFKLPSTRYAPAQWALSNTAVPMYDIGWGRASKKIAKIKPVLIGVVDQGLVTTDDRLKAIAWTNKDEIPDNGLDDDRNGWTDDAHGYNFITGNGQLFFPGSGFSHGSFVSSIIGGRITGAEADVLGIAPNASIVTAVALGPEGFGPDMTILSGLYYLAEQGAKVINLSLGGEVPPFIFYQYKTAHKQLWDHLEEKGVIVVCAAGNSNANNDLRPITPGNLSISRPNVITVCAVDVDGPLGRFKDDDGTWRQYSNYGEKSVTLAAPGSLILGIEDQGKQRIGDGTSYSAPIVTATIALVWGQHPEWDYKTVIRAVTETVTHSRYLKGKCTTEGVLNIEAALKWKP